MFLPKSQQKYLLLWCSKMQTQITLSTIEVEYIALLNSMKDLIAIREILKKILSTVFISKTKITNLTYFTLSRIFEKAEKQLPKSIAYENNTSCLKFATMPTISPHTKHITIPYLSDRFSKDITQFLHKIVRK